MTKLENDKNKVLLGYKLSSHQDALVNYLVPSICACLLYIFIIATDIAVIFCHYKNGDPIWASLTIFIMYLPLLGSFIIIISNWDLWPELVGCGIENIKWFVIKTLEHLLFPIWSMWRFAERIFWSIEAVRSTDEIFIMQAKAVVEAARSIELYVFLQSYVHALPQVLFQLYILMRHNTDINRETQKAQFISLILNLAKVSITTTYYQRFKSQKLTGKQYPWYKSHKLSRPSSVALRSNVSQSGLVVQKRRVTTNIEEIYDLQPPQVSESRRSSDIYLEPSTSMASGGNRRQTFVETDFEEVVNTKAGTENLESKSSNYEQITMLRETSVVDGPKRQVFREQITSEISEPDFNISRVIYVKGLQDDDLAGKLVAFLWWFCFLLVRVLAISVFAYFFIKETVWLLASHYAIIMGFLLYDVKSDEVKRAKAIFFIFIGLIYIFCIIEFKIKFKKATFIYYGYFVLAFIENFVMCMIWFMTEIESIENDFWFRYSFYIIVMGSLISFSSMLFYFTINKPPKVMVKTNL
ncbi:uncharacterized protein LOC108915611 [Anoplophora glabripennis]|uniref:uncharacterized protein LOC108915611 n=1 Tax=Anoplophora glabripennis TaxID=217634 RepID=UPI000874056B|nr:uncharacterized protein LOC108915611 [Anoplophora glabripennis]